jgi:uncharacterized protein YkwD
MGEGKMKRIGIISALLGVLLLVSTSCASGVSQEEYDRVKNELSAIRSEISSLQGKLAEYETAKARYEELSVEYEELEQKFDTAMSEQELMQSKYDDMSTEYEEFSNKYDTLQSDYEALQTRYEELSAEYETLSEQGDAVMEETTEIDEEDVEQALFELINQDRIENGLDELAWRESLYKVVKKNSIDMATNKELGYPEYDVTWRAVYWAAGHNSAGEIAEATHLVWKNRNTYETYFLYVHLDFGAVGVHKSGDIFYITYIGGLFR